MNATRILGVLVLFSTPASAQQRWQRQVDERVQRVVESLPRQPGVPIVTRGGELNTDEAGSLQVTLVQGTPYTIVGVCDDDCFRLQLTLLTAAGSEIAKERNSESLPTVHFMPPTTMTYSVRVVMEGCRWNPCSYAVAVVPVGKNSH